MKAFIVAALLVVAVASQEFDLLKLNKERSMFKFDRPVYNEMMLKQKLGHPLEKFITYGDNVEVPKYLQEYFVDKQVYTIEEIMMTPLFREYMSLPLFRQFWSYPMFQKYVASIFFQRFWELPAFQQYFVNPTLFYKYIYPLVTIFKYDTTTMTSNTFGDDLIKGDYIYRNKNVFPFVYGQRDAFPTMYNQEAKYFDQVYYKNILDKIYNHLYNYEYVRSIVDETVAPVETVYGDRYYNYNKMIPQIYGQDVTYETAYPEMYKYNPYVARTMYGYNKRFPTIRNNFLGEKMQFNKLFNNYNEYRTYETPKMVERIPTMGVQTFDKFEKVIPEIYA